MKVKNILSCLVAALTLVAPMTVNAQNDVTESGNPVCVKPMDALYASSYSSRNPLAHNHIEERDVMWEKRVWREIEVKELKNQFFANEKRSLITILLEAAKKGDITAYSTINDEFTDELTSDRMSEMLYSADTVLVYDINTDTYVEEIVFNEFNHKDVARYRIKEVWYYDSRLSRMNVRILGIAPIINKYTDDGDFLASMPMCWFYFDEARGVLAKEPAYNANNDHGQMSWDDVFVSRDFSSYITKESNNRDLRLQDLHSGVDLLRKSDEIRQSIFNFEHDLYSY